MDLTRTSARALSEAIHRREVSCREVLEAHLDQVARCNPRHFAIESLQNAGELLRQADARDAQLARSESLGWMHGLPIAIKDLAATAGIRMTDSCHGYPITPNRLARNFTAQAPNQIWLSDLTCIPAACTRPWAISAWPRPSAERLNRVH